MSRDTPQPPGPPPSPAADAPTPVVTATLSLHGFADGWPHCHHVADYLARFAASDRFDPEQLTTRLSTYLNEVLELVHRDLADARPDAPAPGRPTGALVIAVRRAADRLRVAVAVPAPGAERLGRSAAVAAGPDAAAEYRRRLAAALGGGPGDGLGLLELAALHGIGFELGGDDGALTVTMIVPHE
jgi:hypothetical protein